MYKRGPYALGKKRMTIDVLVSSNYGFICCFHIVYYSLQWFVYVVKAYLFQDLFIVYVVEACLTLIESLGLNTWAHFLAYC